MIRPHKGEIAEAIDNPGGWVYRIAGEFSQNEDIPPEAIVGAWKVDENGLIVGDFKKNPKYDPAAIPKTG